MSTPDTKKCAGVINDKVNNTGKQLACYNFEFEWAMPNEWVQKLGII
jgi:hypothetical protein